MNKTRTYQVSVTLNAEGDQAHGMVFRDPRQAARESHSFPIGDLVVVDADGIRLLANDDGVIPYRERTSPDEDLGLTWQLAK